MADETTPLAQAYQAYERMEGQLSVALDKLVATNGFADLLATSATNVMALTRLANGTIDRVVRTTRLAARHDVTELARQLARTEAKLERLLQVVEDLQGGLAASVEGEVSSAPAPSVTAPMEAALEPAPNGAVRNGAAPSGDTGRVRASRAAATRTAATRSPGTRSPGTRSAGTKRTAAAKTTAAKTTAGPSTTDGAPASGEAEVT